MLAAQDRVAGALGGTKKRASITISGIGIRRPTVGCSPLCQRACAHGPECDAGGTYGKAPSVTVSQRGVTQALRAHRARGRLGAPHRG